MTVQKTSTDDLNKKLKNAASLKQFLEKNDQEFQTESIPELLAGLIQQKGIRKATLSRQAGMSEVYLHQILSGKRIPSRNRLICLCFGLQATEEETQQLLKHCRCSPLYPKIRRDAILLFGLNHGMDLFEINDQLFDAGEETLF